VLGDGLHEPLVAGRGEVDRAALGAGLVDARQDLVVVRKRGGLETVGVRQVVLEGGLAGAQRAAIWNTAPGLRPSAAKPLSISRSERTSVPSRSTTSGRRSISTSYNVSGAGVTGARPIATWSRRRTGRGSRRGETTLLWATPRRSGCEDQEKSSCCPQPPDCLHGVGPTPLQHERDYENRKLPTPTPCEIDAS
jgi:hypothetical protein